MAWIKTEEEWLACEDPIDLYRSTKEFHDNNRFRWLAAEWGIYIRDEFEDNDRSWFDAFVSFVAGVGPHPSEVCKAPDYYPLERLGPGPLSWARQCANSIRNNVLYHAAACACIAASTMARSRKLPLAFYNHITRENLTDYPSFDPAWIEANWSEFDSLIEAFEKRVEQAFCNQFRDVAGNPFRPVIVRSEWRTSTVEAIARTIRREWAFDRLPYLADALQEAGCDDDQLLDHCRSAGPHVRGCWAVELLSAE